MTLEEQTQDVTDEPCRPDRPLLSRDVLIGGGLFALALAVRLVYLAQSTHSPTFDHPIVDADTYHRIAVKLATQHRPDSGLFWQSPLYPLLLGVLYALSDCSILFVKIVQCLLGATACLLTWRLGRRLFSPAVGMAGAVITALCGPLIFYEIDLVAAGLAAFWGVALLLLFLRSIDDPSPRRLSLLGLCGMLATMTRPTFLPFFAAAAVWLGWKLYRRSSAAKAAGQIAAVAVGFACLALPWAYITHRSTGTWTILPNSGGVNLYIGNNPRADQTINVRPGWQWQALEAQAFQPGRPAPSAAQKQQYFLDQVKRYALDQPLAFAAGLGSKALQYLSGREMPRNEDLYVFREWSPLLSVLAWKVGPLGFPFGLLVPLALLGLIWNARRLPGAVWLFVLLVPAGVILVFVAARYRVEAAPVIAMLAAAGVAAMAHQARGRHWGKLAGSAAVLVGGVALCSLPGPFAQERPNYQAELYLDLAGQYWPREPEQSDLWEQDLRKALAIQPDYPEAESELGGLLASRGRFGEARPYLEHALLHEGRDHIAQANLAVTLYKLGQAQEARQRYERAYAIAPWSPEVARQYAKFLELQGDYAHAAGAYGSALLMEPGDWTLHLAYANTLAQSGQDAAAVREYRAYMAAQWGNLSVPAVRKAICLMASSPDPAARDGKEALRLAGLLAMHQKEPDAATLDLLAAAYAQAGDFDEAVKQSGHAISLANRSADRELAGQIERRRCLYLTNNPYIRLDAATAPASAPAATAP